MTYVLIFSFKYHSFVQLGRSCSCPVDTRSISLDSWSILIMRSPKWINSIQKGATELVSEETICQEIIGEVRYYSLQSGEV